jgi:hypothetical protein
MAPASRVGDAPGIGRLASFRLGQMAEVPPPTGVLGGSASDPTTPRAAGRMMPSDPPGLLPHPTAAGQRPFEGMDRRRPGSFVGGAAARPSLAWPSKRRSPLDQARDYRGLRCPDCRTGKRYNVEA